METTVYQFFIVICCTHSPRGKKYFSEFAASQLRRLKAVLKYVSSRCILKFHTLQYAFLVSQCMINQCMFRLRKMSLYFVTFINKIFFATSETTWISRPFGLLFCVIQALIIKGKLLLPFSNQLEFEYELQLCRPHLSLKALSFSDMGAGNGCGIG